MAVSVSALAVQGCLAVCVFEVRGVCEVCVVLCVESERRPQLLSEWTLREE